MLFTLKIHSNLTIIAFTLKIPFEISQQGLLFAAFFRGTGDWVSPGSYEQRQSRSSKCSSSSSCLVLAIEQAFGQEQAFG